MKWIIALVAIWIIIAPFLFQYEILKWGNVAGGALILILTLLGGRSSKPETPTD